MTTFTELSLSSSLIKVVEELSYTTPTEIQAEAISMLLESDVDFVDKHKQHWKNDSFCTSFIRSPESLQKRDSGPYFGPDTGTRHSS